MAEPEFSWLANGYAEATWGADILRHDHRETDVESVGLAEEVPIAFVYNARPYTVVMATPLDVEDLAVGFSVTEGIVAHAAKLERVEVVRANHGIEIQMELSATDADRLAERSRTLVSRTGCGLCGVETIRDV